MSYHVKRARYTTPLPFDEVEHQARRELSQRRGSSDTLRRRNRSSLSVNEVSPALQRSARNSADTVRPRNIPSGSMTEKHVMNNQSDSVGRIDSLSSSASSNSSQRADTKSSQSSFGSPISNIGLISKASGSSLSRNVAGLNGDQADRGKNLHSPVTEIPPPNKISALRLLASPSKLLVDKYRQASGSISELRQHRQNSRATWQIFNGRKSRKQDVSYEKVNGVIIDAQPATQKGQDRFISIPEIEARDIRKIPVPQPFQGDRDFICESQNGTHKDRKPSSGGVLNKSYLHETADQPHEKLESKITNKVNGVAQEPCPYVMTTPENTGDADTYEEAKDGAEPPTVSRMHEDECGKTGLFVKARQRFSGLVTDLKVTIVGLKTGHTSYNNEAETIYCPQEIAIAGQDSENMPSHTIPPRDHADDDNAKNQDSSAFDQSNTFLEHFRQQAEKPIPSSHHDNGLHQDRPDRSVKM